jgi:hypothetical protein
VGSGQLAVVLAVASAGPVAAATVAKGDVGALEDPWSKFCAGGEIASAAAAKGVAASVAQQLKYVSVTSVYNCIVLWLCIDSLCDRRLPSPNALLRGR